MMSEEFFNGFVSGFFSMVALWLMWLSIRDYARVNYELDELKRKHQKR